MAPHLKVPAAPARARVEHVPLVGRVRVYTLAVPDRPAPATNDVERLTSHLLEHGSCAECGHALSRNTYLPGADKAACSAGHLNDLRPALQLFRHRETR